MALVQGSGNIDNFSQFNYAWKGALTGSTFNAIQSGKFTDKNFQITGVFGTASFATIKLMGSNDGGTTWFQLHDAFGNLISVTNTSPDTGGTIAESPLMIQPQMTSGDAGTNLNIYIVGQRGRG